ncbi:hypothetical protein ANN_28080 [Periplaneta americana]|uniref:C2H2-type domain-containing protein n=1 Tax=Periplaneta americana TaxID=6978 RepID=A0ABQ8RUW6_PERAM|nr:hypothetical protein ANN_28080 [Periplaneta americana]
MHGKKEESGLRGPGGVVPKVWTGGKKKWTRENRGGLRGAKWTQWQGGLKGEMDSDGPKWTGRGRGGWRTKMVTEQGSGADRGGLGGRVDSDDMEWTKWTPNGPEDRFWKIQGLVEGTGSHVFLHKAMVDVMKMEREIDPLAIGRSNITDIVEGNILSQEGNLSHLDVTDIKTECMDQSYDIKSKIKVEDTTPVPISFPVVKTEVVEDSLDVARVQQEEKVTLPSEEDEVLTESFVDHDEKRVIRERTDLDREENNLIECGNNIPDCSNGSDVSHNYIKCSMCNEVFISEQCLKLHFQIHTKMKPLRCDVCGESFSSSSNLNTHACVHGREKPFKCDVCGKCFLENGGLRRHVRIHTGQKRFKCEVCGKRFSQSGDLNKHVRIHTGQKPFKCEECGKCFSVSTHLSAHTRTHTGEKPFKCDICGKCFLQCGGLSRHVRIHTGQKQFKCEMCGKCFSESWDLRKHIRIHTGQKPFKCKVEFCSPDEHTS